MLNMKLILSTAVIIIFLGMHAVTGIATASEVQSKGLDERVRDAKKEVLDIASELQMLEEKLLYPSYSQIAIFVSLKNNGPFDLDTIDIKIDGKRVARHKYTSKEFGALKQGGVQRIYTGNIKLREHKLEASISGRLSNNKKFRRNASHTIVKGVYPAIVEIRLAGSDQKRNIEFYER